MMPFFPPIPPYGDGNMYPYTNFHDMNMDWIIAVVKNFLDNYTHIQEQLQQSTNEGLAELEAKKTQLEYLLNQWYNTHSNDIATQLANAITEINAQVANVISSIPQDYSKTSRMVSDTKDTTLDSMRQFVENIPYLQLYPLFYTGGISGTTGLPTADNSQTHSEFIFIGGGAVKFNPKNGYLLHARYYSNRDYSTFVSADNSVSGLKTRTPANYMVLVCTRDDFSANITEQESGGNVQIYSKNIYYGFIMSNENNEGGYVGNVNVDTVNKVITFGSHDDYFCRLCYSGRIINVRGKTLNYSNYASNYAYVLYNLTTQEFELMGATNINAPTSQYVIIGTIWGLDNTIVNLNVYPCYYVNGIRTVANDVRYVLSDVHTRQGANTLRIGILGDSTSTFTGTSESSLNNVSVRGAYYPASDIQNVSEMWFNQLRTMLRTNSDYIVSAISRCSYRDQNEPLQPPVWDDYRIARLKTLTGMKYLFLWCGNNEQWTNDTNIGDPTYKYDVSALESEQNTACRGVELTIRKIQTEIPSTEIVMIIPPFTWGSGVTSKKPFTRFRKELMTIAKTYGVKKIIDLAKCITPANVNTYTIDGIHPNKAGMKRIGHYIANQMLTDNTPVDW